MRSYAPTLSTLLLATALACTGGERAELGPLDGRELAPVDTGRVAVGDLAPDFRLAAYDGPPVQLSQFQGQKEVLLVFYRGHW